MKKQEKIKARKLRREEGLSVKKIAKELSVSPSSVSLWVRDIKLSDEQKARLINNHGVKLGQIHGSRRVAELAKAKREEYQKLGRDDAKKGNIRHSSCCMLYWAEGNKSRNMIRMSNTDVRLISFFLDGLKDNFNLKNEDFSIYINCYTNNGITLEEIENYWLKKLSLPKKCLRKSVINNYPNSSKRMKQGKTPYGCCYLTLCRTDIVQRVYGVIQEYAGFQDNVWIE